MDEQLGLGVRIRLLYGNKETVEAMRRAIGKKIRAVALTVNRLRLTMAHGALTLWDDGQSCCEYRYMHTDDNLAYFTNTVLEHIEVREAQHIHDSSECHEVQFLVVTTGKGAFTIANHNEHNGCYGGFSLKATFEEA